MLVIGGAGFIGAEVVRLLVERDEPVHVAFRSGALQRLHGVTDRISLCIRWTWPTRPPSKRWCGR